MKGFCCPKCKSHVLEEVMVNVTVASTIRSVDLENAEVEYGEQTNAEDGEVVRYQCNNCGQTIAKSTEDLICWLKRHPVDA